MQIYPPEHDGHGHVQPLNDAFDGKMFVHRNVDRSDLDVYEYRVYGHLVSRVGSESVAPSPQAHIATITGISMRHVSRALASLEEKGWIRRQANLRPNGARDADSIWVAGPPHPPRRYEPSAEETAAVRRKAGKTQRKAEVKQ